MTNTRTVDEGNPRGKMQCSQQEFEVLAGLIEDRTGLTFPLEKRREFSYKLDKLDTPSEIGSINELLDAVSTSDEVLQKVINVLTVGESYFFRNRPHFAALKSVILPQLIMDAEDRRELNIWCAGCANGEEPYSIAMLLEDSFSQLRGWKISILATDINTQYLTNARKGVFRNWSFRGVDDSTRERHFKKTGEATYQISRDIARKVDFKRFNLAGLLSGTRPFDGNLDLVLCRNVLIYFPFQTADNIIDRMKGMIRPGGYLLVGHSEAFPSLGNFEVIYSNATYFYRRYINEATALLSMPAAATASIPGMAVRASYMPSMYDNGIGFPTGPGMLTSHDNEPDPVAQLNTAKEMANTGRTEDALKLLESLAETSGRLDFRVHFLSAIVYDHKGLVLRAIESLKRAIFLNKNFVVGHYFLGVISQREGDNSIAERHFKNALRLLDKLPPEHQLEESEGVTALRLKEIIMGLFEEITYKGK